MFTILLSNIESNIAIALADQVANGNKWLVLSKAAATKATVMGRLANPSATVLCALRDLNTRSDWIGSDRIGSIQIRSDQIGSIVQRDLVRLVVRVE